MKRALEITEQPDFYETRADAYEAAAAVARAKGDIETAREQLTLALAEYEQKQDETGAARIRKLLSAT